MKKSATDVYGPTARKSIGWSYPSSPNARRFGHYATGCWTVAVDVDGKLPNYRAGFADPVEALRCAERIDLPWCKLFLRLMPDAVRGIFPKVWCVRCDLNEAQNERGECSTCERKPVRDDRDHEGSAD